MVKKSPALTHSGTTKRGPAIRGWYRLRTRAAGHILAAHARMAPNVLYTSCVLGAAALYMLLRPGRGGLKTAGALLGLGALGWVARESAAALGFPGRGP